VKNSLFACLLEFDDRAAEKEFLFQGLPIGYFGYPRASAGRSDAVGRGFKKRVTHGRIASEKEPMAAAIGSFAFLV